MKIVTGYKGTPHITSQDQQGFNYGITGMTNCVFNVGSRFNATYANETLTIHDGEGVMQGVHFRIPYGETDSITFSPTSAGYTRIDLVCARYTKAAGTGIESVDWYVHQGTPKTSNPTAPSPTSGNIPAGATVADFAMWKVTVNSSGITDVTRLFSDGCTLVVNKSGSGTITSSHSYNLGTYGVGTYLVTGVVSFRQTAGTATRAAYSYYGPYGAGTYMQNGSVEVTALNVDYVRPTSIVIQLTEQTTLELAASISTGTYSFMYNVHVIKIA